MAAAKKTLTKKSQGWRPGLRLDSRGSPCMSVCVLCILRVNMLLCSASCCHAWPDPRQLQDSCTQDVDQRAGKHAAVGLWLRRGWGCWQGSGIITCPSTASLKACMFFGHHSAQVAQSPPTTRCLTCCCAVRPCTVPGAYTTPGMGQESRQPAKSIASMRACCSWNLPLGIPPLPLQPALLGLILTPPPPAGMMWRDLVQ